MFGKYFILFLGVLLNTVIHAQPAAVKAYMNEKFFYSPESGSYVEIQLHFDGATVKSKKITNGIHQGQLLVSQEIKYYTSTMHRHQVVVNSPVSSTGDLEDFVDIYRFSLAPGEYIYRLEIEDLNSNVAPVVLEKKLIQPEIEDKIIVSDIVPAIQITNNQDANKGGLVKSGYEILPMASNYYPRGLNYLPYYVEIYNNDPLYLDSVYVIRERIIDKVSDTELHEFTRYFRYEAISNRIIVKNTNITDLPSGKYYLEIAVINRRKDVLAQNKITFVRNNRAFVNNLENGKRMPFDIELDPDSTKYYVASLIPIAGNNEVKVIIKLLKEKNNEKNLDYLQSFWVKTHPERPMEAWLEYKEQVKQVQRLFATNFQKGYETDRGRVYLQYGEPNQISIVPSSPSEYPYEIWQYDKIANFSNRRFIFYSPTNLNNDFKLLHSDMIGEIQNRRWQFALNKRNTYDGNIDDNRGAGFQNHFGGNSSLYYNSY